MKKVSRRAFLGGVAVASLGAGAALTGCSPQTASETSNSNGEFTLPSDLKESDFE